MYFSDNNGIFLKPGEIVVSSSKEPIHTILGSCVAVCLIDPIRKIGGMNHFMISTATTSKAISEKEMLVGEPAMVGLLEKMLSSGSFKDDIIAKAFGGGTVISESRIDVAGKNIGFAKTWLRNNDIPLIAEDFGGCYSRKIFLIPNTGEVFCRKTQF